MSLTDLWDGIQVYLLYLLMVAVHEAGHLLANALLGYPWSGVIIGPLNVSREDGPVRVSYSKTPLGGYALGFHNPRDTRTRRAIGIAAGPAATLLLGIVLTLVLLPMTQAQQNAQWQVTALWVISAYLFVFSVIPYRRRASKDREEFRNDGALLVQLWRDKEQWTDYYAHRDEHNARWAAHRAEYIRYRALTEVLASMEAGRRPRDWDSAAVARATALQDGQANDVTAAHYAFYWAEDRDDPETSGRHIGRALALRDGQSDSYQAKILLDAAYHAGFRRRDASAARALLAEAWPLPASDEDDRAMLRSMTLRAEAATLLAEGRLGEARAKAEEGLASLSAVKANDRADRCLLERLAVASETPEEGQALAALPASTSRRRAAHGPEGRHG